MIFYQLPSNGSVLLIGSSRKNYVWSNDEDDEPATDASCDFGLGDAGYRDPQYGVHNVSEATSFYALCSI